MGRAVRAEWYEMGVEGWGHIMEVCRPSSGFPALF